MEWVLINNKNIMKYTKSQLEEIALNEDEYNLILEKLGRDPNYLELDQDLTNAPGDYLDIAV